MAYEEYIEETRDLLRRIRARGFKILSVSDTEETLYSDDDEAMIECLRATGFGIIRVQYQNEPRSFSFILVYGNSPGELVADYTYNSNWPEACKALDEVATEHYDEWS